MYFNYSTPAAATIPLSAFSFGGYGESVVAPLPALAALAPLSTPQTTPAVANALDIVRMISQFHSIPWRVPFVVLEHEGGVRIFNHHDGVMQTTDGAKTGAIRS